MLTESERQPAAIWQYQRRLALVDAAGRVIEQVRLEGTPLPDLPIVIGPGANLRLAALADLLAVAPQLKPMLDGASWIGNRRWDIRFRSGETLPRRPSPPSATLRPPASSSNSVLIDPAKPVSNPRGPRA